MPVLLGDYLTLSCLSEPLNVDWFLNDTLLSTNTTRMLVLLAVLSHNLGLYTCRRRSDNSSSQPFHVYSRGNKLQLLVRDYGVRHLEKSDSIQLHPASKSKMLTIQDFYQQESTGSLVTEKN